VHLVEKQFGALSATLGALSATLRGGYLGHTIVKGAYSNP